MAFKASDQHLADQYVLTKREAAALKVRMQIESDKMATGDINSDDILIGQLARLRSARDVFAAGAATQGMGQYAKDQEDDQTYDVVAEFQLMEDAVQNAIDVIVAMFPTSGDSYIDSHELQPGTGILIPRVFEQGLPQMTQLKNAIDAVIAAID